MPNFTLHQGDCLDVLRQLPDNSVDSICTDPPYGLSFMSHKWDYGVPSVEVWREALRVLKPGGHLLAFSGARTYHRMVTAIEDGGFEIRDQLMWVYGSGFPKSQDVSKAIDKQYGVERDVIGVGQYASRGRRTDNKVYGQATPSSGEVTTSPTTDAAKQWQGWGSALKPAHEPVCLARKPLSGKTIAANVLAHGTGAINIDGCRVATADRIAETTNQNIRNNAYKGDNSDRERDTTFAQHNLGRWPANLLHDGSDEVLQAFPNAPGQQCDVSTVAPSDKTSNVYGRMKREGEPSADSDNTGHVGFKMKPGARRLDSGSAARFFYCGKASKKDREEGNGHPTVKPTEVCRWLVRLITPPGGTTLDMYCGSGSFGKAAMLEGFNFIGIDLDRDADGASMGYLDIASRRIAAAQAVAFDGECDGDEL